MARKEITDNRIPNGLRLAKMLIAFSYLTHAVLWSPIVRAQPMLDPLAEVDPQRCASWTRSAYLEPVKAALSDRAGDDAKLLELLQRVDLLVPEIFNPDMQPNAWARGNQVEVDLNYFYYVLGVAEAVATGMIGSPQSEQVMYQASYDYGQKYRQAVESDSQAPIFRFRIEDYSDDLLFRTAVHRLAPIVLEQILTWVTLHELGHHYEGHIRASFEILPPSDLRKQEEEADAWAFKKMDEFGYPMNALADYFALEGALELVRRLSFGIEPGRTHPTYVDRHLTIQAYSFVRTMPQSQWKAFIAFLRTPEPSSSELRHRILTIYVPSKEVVRNELPLALMHDGESIHLMIMEYQHDSIHIYGRNEEAGFRNELFIENQHAYNSPFRMTVTFPKSGKVSALEGSIFQEPAIDHFVSRRRIGGVTLEYLSNETSMALFDRSLYEVTSDAKARNRCEAVQVKFLRTIGETLLLYAKGQLDAIEFEQKVESLTMSARQDLEEILGKDPASHLYSRLLEDPVTTLFLSKRVSPVLVPVE